MFDQLVSHIIRPNRDLYRIGKLGKMNIYFKVQKILHSNLKLIINLLKSIGKTLSFSISIIRRYI
jgi:hypothetical protein